MKFALLNVVKNIISAETFNGLIAILGYKFLKNPSPLNDSSRFLKGRRAIYLCKSILFLIRLDILNHTLRINIYI